MQVLLYDDKEMHVFSVLGYQPKYIDFSEFNAEQIEDICARKAIFPNITYDAELYIGEVKAELDPTTMKRIAKYNLDKDFDALNEKIKKAEERLENLNGRAKKFEEKFDFMKELFWEIWMDDSFEREKYLPDKNDYWEVE